MTDDAAIAKIVVDAFATVFGRHPNDVDEVREFVKACLGLRPAASPTTLSALFRQRHGRPPRDVDDLADWIAERSAVRH